MNFLKFGKGSIEILWKLLMGDARFNDLNFLVRNTRTLTNRLKELESLGLIEKANGNYRITGVGLRTLMKTYDADLTGRGIKGIEGLERDWLRIPFEKLTKLFLREFKEGLVSIVLYGSSVKGNFEVCKSDIDVFYVVEDWVKNVWGRESEIFRRFASTREYSAFDRWFKIKGSYGYPEITTTSLRRSQALKFQPIYLDMIFNRAILHDKDRFLERLILKLRDELESLGAMKVELPDGSWYWVLKPGLKPGEPLKIELRNS